jgi:hypothetical protein
VVVVAVVVMVVDIHNGGSSLSSSSSAEPTTSIKLSTIIIKNVVVITGKQIPMQNENAIQKKRNTSFQSHQKQNIFMPTTQLHQHKSHRRRHNTIVIINRNIAL